MGTSFWFHSMLWSKNIYFFFLPLPPFLFFFAFSKLLTTHKIRTCKCEAFPHSKGFLMFKHSQLSPAVQSSQEAVQVVLLIHFVWESLKKEIQISQNLFLTWRLANASYLCKSIKPSFSKCKFHLSFLCGDAPALLYLDWMSVYEVRYV